MKKILFGFLAVIIMVSSACEKETTEDENPDNPLAPKIVSITSDKMSIVSGPDDPATIICTATGDNLEYLWEVDLGDITVPDGSDGSTIMFTAADCCEGDREVKCKVSNEHGYVKGSVTLHVTVVYP